MRVTGNSMYECISVQVSLSGYVSKVESNGVSVSSGWMTADRFFTDPVFRRRYDDVKISVFTPKFTLVPEHFFAPHAIVVPAPADAGSAENRPSQSNLRSFTPSEKLPMSLVRR